MINKKQLIKANKDTLYEFINSKCLNKSNREIIDLLAKELVGYQEFMYKKGRLETEQQELKFIDNIFKMFETGKADCKCVLTPPKKCDVCRILHKLSKREQDIGKYLKLNYDGNDGIPPKPKDLGILPNFT